VTDPQSRRSWSAGVFVFLAGALCLGVAYALVHLVVGDDEWDWGEFAFRAVGGGLTVLLFAAITPPRRYRKIQRAVTVAIFRGRLPRGLDRDLWRGALLHQRTTVWVWRRLVPLLLGGSAVLFVVSAVVSPVVVAPPLWLVPAGLAAAAVGSFVAGGRQRSAIEGLLARLDEPGVPTA
jgi:hypothetical protein